VATTNVEDIYELSPLQRGMLLHTVHDGSSDMYLGQHVYIVDGRLDTEALVQAWREEIAAHPSLRASFHWEDLDKPLQVVHREVVPPVHRADWSDLDEDAQRVQLDLMMVKDRAEGFDLTTAPLQRLHMVRLGEDRHALALSHHHLLFDGWSVPLFMNEIMARYQALTAGGPLPPPAPPYRDYIGWLQRQDPAGAEAFWKKTMAGTAPFRFAPQRPVDPRQGTGLVERHVVDIAGAVEDGLREAALRHRVTPNALLQAAWSVVLQRYSGGSDVVFGCVSSGRPADLPDVDRMIGMFVNTLPIPITVPADGELGPWLRAIQQTNAEIRRYEYSPLSDIKRWAGAPGRDLFDSLFVLGNYAFLIEVDDDRAGRLSVRSQTTYDKVSVPLSLIVTPAPISELHLLYHRDRFDPEFIADVCDRLLAVIDALVHADAIAPVLEAAGPAPEMPAEPDEQGSSPGSGPRHAETPEEEAIAAVYRDILEVSEVDVTASFFELGGDSFGAVRAVGRIENATLAMLALNPSVRALALAVANVDPGEGGDALDAEIAELERQLAEKTLRVKQARAAADPSADAADPARFAGGGTVLERQLSEYYGGLGQDEEIAQANSGHGDLEFERTKEILLRHLPPAPAVIADIGGGLGRYALWLCGLGYRVVYRDIVPLLVEQFVAALSPGDDVDYAVGDARDLDLPDESVDAVLLLGPLYHLPEAEDRLRVISEARRIVRPGGAVFAAAVSRWAARLDGTLRERMYERGAEIMGLIDAVEQTGVLPPLARGGYTAYTHRPSDLAAELEQAGLELADLVGVEGAAFLLTDLAERMADPRARQAILEGARAHERIPELLGIGPHLVATGRKRTV